MTDFLTAAEAAAPIYGTAALLLLIARALLFACTPRDRWLPEWLVTFSAWMRREPNYMAPWSEREPGEMP